MKLNKLFLILVILVGCRPVDNGSSQESFRYMKKVERIRFSMLGLRSGKFWAFNPKFNANVLPTRYSKRVKVALRPFIAVMPEPCFATGIEGIATGGLIHSTNHSEIILVIDDVSDLRPLPEAARREMILRSPTLQKQTIC